LVCFSHRPSLRPRRTDAYLTIEYATDAERLMPELLDRLTHRCFILEATGASYRETDAQRRTSGLPSAPREPVG
jgi:hypothetical protein